MKITFKKFLSAFLAVLMIAESMTASNLDEGET